MSTSVIAAASAAACDRAPSLRYGTGEREEERGEGGVEPERVGIVEQRCRRTIRAAVLETQST